MFFSLVRKEQKGQKEEGFNSRLGDADTHASHCLIPPVSATPTHALRVCVNSHADPQYTLKTLPPFSHRRMQILPLFAPEVGSDLRIMRKYGEKSGKLVNFFQNN